MSKTQRQQHRGHSQEAAHTQSQGFMMQVIGEVGKVSWDA